MEILILLFLVVVNAVFAMAEMAVVSSRRMRLQQAADHGDKGAAAALALANAPTRFLSTVQVGITMIAIFMGAFGERTLADDLRSALASLPALAPHAGWLSFLIVALAITYISLVIGELVPKRLALNNPERIAGALAPSMRMVAKVASPLVGVLSGSTDVILRLLGARSPSAQAVSEEEIKGLIAQGAKSGVFHETEHKLVERVFRLGDRVVSELMVPRTEIDWLPADASVERVRVAVATSPHSHFPVCRGSLDHIIGVVHVKDLVKHGLISDRVDIIALAQQPLFVPETMPALRALESFRQAHTHIAFVLDEYGAIEGLITLNDIVEAIVGEITRQGEETDPEVVQRADGSWLLDGLLPIDRLRELMNVRSLPAEDRAEFVTVGGLVMSYLGRVPRTGDTFEWGRFRFEVVDMDRQRVDKVLLSAKPEAPRENAGSET